jgi:hypothetical protein
MNDKEWDRMKKILAKYDLGSQSAFSRKALLELMKRYPLRNRKPKAWPNGIGVNRGARV